MSTLSFYEITQMAVMRSYNADRSLRSLNSKVYDGITDNRMTEKELEDLVLLRHKIGEAINAIVDLDNTIHDIRSENGYLQPERK